MIRIYVKSFQNCPGTLPRRSGTNLASPIYSFKDRLFSHSKRLTHWGWVTYIFVTNVGIIGSDNGLSPVWHQAIIWTNALFLSTRLLGTKFSQIVFVIQTFLFKKMHLKMSSGKYCPFCLSLNMLRMYHQFSPFPQHGIWTKGIRSSNLWAEPHG